jgi:hypothetical protein
MAPPHHDPSPLIIKKLNSRLTWFGGESFSDSPFAYPIPPPYGFAHCAPWPRKTFR